METMPSLMLPARAMALTSSIHALVISEHQEHIAAESAHNDAVSASLVPRTARRVIDVIPASVGDAVTFSTSGLNSAIIIFIMSSPHRLLLS